MRPARSKSFGRNSESVPPQAAFSLIEIVLAIGVFAFAIVAILALISIGANSNQAGANDTVLASMTQYVDSYVRQQGFTTVSAAYASGTTAIFYFDASGSIMLTGSGSADTSGAGSNIVYSCAVSCTSAAAVPATRLATQNLLYLRYDFRWPVAAHHANPDRTVYSSLANNG